MPVLFSTTPHNSTRQMRIKSQNMMVLTLEFTNFSFSRRRKGPPRLPTSIPGNNPWPKATFLRRRSAL
jgi:hypothetical protein